MQLNGRAACSQCFPLASKNIHPSSEKNRLGEKERKMRNVKKIEDAGVAKPLYCFNVKHRNVSDMKLQERADLRHAQTD